MSKTGVHVMANFTNEGKFLVSMETVDGKTEEWMTANEFRRFAMNLSDPIKIAGGTMTVGDPEWFRAARAYFEQVWKQYRLFAGDEVGHFGFSLN